MKFFVALILTAILSFVSGLFLPWWGIAIVALLVGALVAQSAGRAFFSGFLGVFILWAGIAWLINSKNDGVMAGKIARVLPLGGNELLLVLMTAVVGGLVAGLAAMTGSYMRKGKA